MVPGMDDLNFNPSSVAALSTFCEPPLTDQIFEMVGEYVATPAVFRC
jgi:hypothetical protein